MVETWCNLVLDATGEQVFQDLKDEGGPQCTQGPLCMLYVSMQEKFSCVKSYFDIIRIKSLN